jgi:lysophospholipase L1-like esterase
MPGSKSFRSASSRLAVGFVSLMAGLVFAEVSLRLLSEHWIRSYDVEMWRYARLIKVISLHPDVVEEHRPNAGAVLMGVRVRTDDNGFRLPDGEAEARRRPEDRKVLALGDSLTLGWGVPEGQTFPDQLEKLLGSACTARGERGASVYNAGIGNCNTAMELARYQKCIRPRLRPDWVILGFSFNDAELTPAPERAPLLWNSALFALGYARFLRRWDPALRDYSDYYVGLFRDGRPGWERTRQALRELGASLRGEGIPGTMLLMPELHEPHATGIAEAFSRVAAVGRESGFEVIDGTPEFPPGSGKRYWVSPEDAHPDAAAQALYARALGRSAYACLP